MDSGQFVVFLFKTKKRTNSKHVGIFRFFPFRCFFFTAGNGALEWFTWRLASWIFRMILKLQLEQLYIYIYTYMYTVAFFFVTCLFREYGKGFPENSKIQKFKKLKKKHENSKIRKFKNSKIRKFKKFEKPRENSKIRKFEKTKKHSKIRKFETTH